MLSRPFLVAIASLIKCLALTFDDGPHPIYTEAVLDVLAEAGVHATFFLLGREVEKHPLVARKIVAAGHAVGAHSFDHKTIPKQSASALGGDLERCQRVIASATGVETKLFRPPKGEVTFDSIRNVCGQGYRVVHWSKTFSDYHEVSAAALQLRIEAAGVKAGDILLFHDHNPHTVQALRTVIPAWVSSGLTFATLSDRSPGCRPSVITVTTRNRTRPASSADGIAGKVEKAVDARSELRERASPLGLHGVTGEDSPSLWSPTSSISALAAGLGLVLSSMTRVRPQLVAFK